MTTTVIKFEKMADKQTPRTFVEALSLSTKKFDALCEQSRREKVAKVLARRRKKWKERHNTIQGKQSLIDSFASQLLGFLKCESNPNKQ